MATLTVWGRKMLMPKDEILGLTAQTAAAVEFARICSLWCKIKELVSAVDIVSVVLLLISREIVWWPLTSDYCNIYWLRGLCLLFNCCEYNFWGGIFLRRNQAIHAVARLHYLYGSHLMATRFYCPNAETLGHYLTDWAHQSACPLYYTCSYFCKCVLFYYPARKES